MKKARRIAALLTCMIYMIAFATTAFATEVVCEDGKSESNGVIVTTTADEEMYLSGDTAKFKITVENTNDYDIENVVLNFTNSANVSMKEAKQVIQELKAGQKQTIEMEGVLSSQTEAPFGMRIGDTFYDGALLIGIAVAVVAVIVIIIVAIVLAKKKKAKKTVASILAVTLLSSSVLATPADVKAVSVHDPSIVKDEKTGDYYIFGSHMAWAKTSDLISWEGIRLNINNDYDEIFADVWNNYACTKENSDLSGNLWAPDVVWNETMQKYCMYMSVNGSGWHSAIALLTADNIEGPYEYVDEVVFSGFWDAPEGSLESTKMKGEKIVRVNTEDVKLNFLVGFQKASEYETREDYADIYKVVGEGANLYEYKNTDKNCINAIDPCVSYDKEGNLWMTYGSWSAGIYQLKIDMTTGLRDYTMKYEDVENVSDDYLGYKIAGGFYNSGEGPYILQAGDYYYLFLSYGNLEASGGYNMRVFRSESINGPYVDENGKSSILTYWDASIGYKDLAVTSKYNTNKGMKIFGSYDMYGISSVQVAQGHNSAIVGDDGKIYLVYHTRFAGAGEGHEVRVHQMFINENGWLVVAPYAYSGETLSTTGYTVDEIAGDYEFVFHDPKKVYVETATSVDKGVCMSENITLTADGKITGAHTGTWKVTTGANVVLTIDGVDYSGVFLKQKTESTDEEVMTFTAAGANNTVWGVQPPK